jgi:homoaconitate hydratase
MSRTHVERIVERHAVGFQAGRPPRTGDAVWLRPDRLMTHDNTSAVLARFRAMGGTRVARPENCVIALDHDIQNRAEGNLAKYAAIERFAREQGIEFHPPGSGIGHQLVVERGYARAGDLVVAADSHANMYGALGALGTAVARSDAAAIWAAGLFWWEVPPVVRVVLEGKLPAGSTGKDAALLLCALYPDDVLGAAVEFHGPGIAALSTDDRLTMANLTTEWGAVAGLFAEGPAERGASYASTIRLSLDDASPTVSGPDTLARAVPVSELAGQRIPIRKAYLVSCANGRLSDLEAAAAVLRGRRVDRGVRLYLAAASASVERAAIASGAWGTLLEAGAIPLPSGCGPCIGLGTGLLEDGEIGISASNRNFKGRMGSAGASCYLASPAVVAASAAAGFVCGPGGIDGRRPARRIERHETARTAAAKDGEEPAGGPSISGRLVAFLRDGIDTDALCPARFVYADATTRDELAREVFASLDPALAGRLRPGDILVAGSRFGIGSSREQAVLALQAAGIRAVVAWSLAPVFRRNAWNNGLLAIEAPELVAALRGRLPQSADAAIIPGGELTLDLAASRAAYGGMTAPLTPLPAVGRDLIAAGGLDAWVRSLGASAEPKDGRT